MSLRNPDNKEMRKCHSRSLAVFGFCLTLATSFQNFMSIPLERLKLARFQPRIQSAWARTEGQGDIREIAPRRPASLDAPVIAAPMSGDNLESISQDWMQRQANLITGGQDQILLKEMNQKMNSAFRQMSGSGDVRRWPVIHPPPWM